jgi:hypothetical protein
LETAGFQHGIYLVRIKNKQGRILQMEKLVVL